MSKTKISWCDEVWNPVTGCTKVSAGCQNCYAEQMALRLQKMGQPKYKNAFQVNCHEDELKRKFPGKGKKIFVNSMSDLFHDYVLFEFIQETMDFIRRCNRQHTFIVLTKRPERVKLYCNSRLDERRKLFGHTASYSLPDNLWLGVSVENQETANKRIPVLLQIPAAIRFISFEPMIENIKLPDLCTHEACNSWSNYPCDNETCPSRLIDWVICGGESGNNARPLHPDWVRSLRDKCSSAGVPFFFKQWGAWEPFYNRDEDPAWKNIPREIPGKVRYMNIDGGWGFHGNRVVYFKKTKVKPLPILDGKVLAQFPAVKQ